MAWWLVVVTNHAYLPLLGCILLSILPSQFLACIAQLYQRHSQSSLDDHCCEPETDRAAAWLSPWLTAGPPARGAATARHGLGGRTPAVGDRFTLPAAAAKDAGIDTAGGADGHGSSIRSPPSDPTPGPSGERSQAAVVGWTGPLAAHCDRSGQQGSSLTV